MVMLSPSVVTNMMSFNKINIETCVCAPREMSPNPPTELLFPHIQENVPKLKSWIEDYYGSITFNRCEHRPLPMMKGWPPLRLHIDSKAKPVAAHKYSPVPVHFEEIVKQELNRALGWEYLKGFQ